MATIVTRAAKGSALTHNEVDANFVNLNTDKVEKSGTDPIVISVNSSSDALRITQTGAGNALVVEDSANPDSTPFVVDASGNVGIGTTSLSSALDISRSGTAQIRFTKTAGTSQYVDIGTGGGADSHYIFGYGNYPLIFGTNTATRMTLTSDGILGIGTTTPQAGSLLTVAGTSVFGRTGSIGYTQLIGGTANNTGYLAFFDASDVRQAYIGYIGSPNDALNIETDSGSNKPIRFATNAATRMTITSAGNVGIGTSTPVSALEVRGDITVGPNTVGRAAINGGSATDSGFFALWNSDFSVRQGYFGFATLAGNGVMDVWSQTTGNAIRFGTNNAERMRITGAGDVGIGASAPSSKVEIQTTGQNPLTLRTTTTGQFDAATIYLNTSGGSANQGTVLYHGIESASDSTNTTFQIQQRANSYSYTRTMYLIDYKNQWHEWATTGTTRFRASDTSVQFVNALVMPNQGAPTTKNAGATLTGAELITGLLNYTGSSATVNLPTGTNIEGALTWVGNNVCLDFFVVNTGSGTCTIGANGNTTLGTLTVASNTSAQFRIRRTAANTFTVYRL